MTNTGTSGTPNAKAGAAFTLTAVAGAGYDGAPSINSALVSAHAGAVQVGAIAGSFGAANSATGTATGSSFTYSEVGNFTLGVDAVYDSSFTSVDPPGTDCTNDFSNALVGGKVGCSFGNTSAAGPFGRFTPDHFDVTMNTPSFGTACGSFTYVGQSFSYTTAPVLTVTARNAAALGNATTRNYIGPNDGSSWWKITASSLTGKAYSQLPASPALTASATSPDPLIATGGDGTGTLTFNSGAGFSFTRGSPVAAFDAEIALAINVIDADAVAYAGNPAHIGTASTGNGIAFNSGKNMRFGELALGSAAGTTSQILYLPVHANYWNGTGWVTNTADACTGAALAQASIVLGNQVKKPGTGGTFATSIIASPSLTSTWSQGTGQIALAAPNAPGTAQVALNLGSAVNDASCTGWSVTSTGAALPWLRGPWCGSSYTNDPSTLAIFGLASSSQPFVFMRENY
jgi:MSHA biogenesis protein MshQ